MGRASNLGVIGSSGRLKPKSTPAIIATPSDVAEFRGFFFGEGSITHHGFRNPNKQHLVLSVTMRGDELPTLQWIKDRFGGSATVYARRSANPMAIWLMTRRNDVRAVLQVLAGGGITASKRTQVQIAQQIIQALDEGLPASHEMISALFAELSAAKDLKMPSSFVGNTFPRQKPGRKARPTKTGMTPL